MVEGLVVAGVLGMRFLVPLIILRYPLPGIVASMLADSVDGAIFANYTSLSLDNYQFYDKSLDIYYLAIAYVSILRNWVDPAAISIARFLWYYRLVGVALFAVVDDRAILFLFPATFEYFFIYYEVVRLRWRPERLTMRHLVTVAAVAWVVLKLPQEYWLHVAEGSTTDWMKEHVFGMDPATPRLEVLAANLWAIPVALIIAGSIAGVGAVALRWAPAADHPLSLDANRYGPGGVPVSGRPRPVEPLLSPALAEKLVLIPLISLVFAQFLPGVDARVLQMTLVLAILVILNALISSWQGRRGEAWRSAAVEFAAMVMVNSGLVLLVAIMARWSEATLSIGSALFYSVLLSLLITLYDRYRHQGDPAALERRAPLDGPADDGPAQPAAATG